MTTRRNYTQELLKFQQAGREIYWSTALLYTGQSRTGEWPVMYAPRYKSDPRPWVTEGLNHRLSGRACHAEKRYEAQRLQSGKYWVWDRIREIDSGTFEGHDAVVKAMVFAGELNRKDIAGLLNKKGA